MSSSSSLRLLHLTQIDEEDELELVINTDVVSKIVIALTKLPFSWQVWQCDWRMELEGLLADGGSESEIISALQEKVPARLKPNIFKKTRI